jgi:hypothetical protein
LAIIASLRFGNGLLSITCRAGFCAVPNEATYKTGQHIIYNLILKKMKKVILSVTVALLSMAACKKQSLKNQPDHAAETTEQTSLASASCLGVFNVPQFPKAYLANYNTQGGCSLPPVPSFNGTIDFMSPTNGSAQTTVRQNCYLTGMAQHPFNCRLYYAYGVSSQGYSKLAYADAAGCVTFVADIQDASNQPFYLEEMEFKNDNGDLYVLRKGDYQYIYVISSADVLDGDFVVMPIRMTLAAFSNTLNKRLSLTRNGNFIRLVMEQVTNGPTSVYNVNSNGTLTGVATYSVPNAGSNNISTYYHNGILYLLRNNANTGSGTLYQLNVAAPTVSPSVGTVFVNNVHDMTLGGICAP